MIEVEATWNGMKVRGMAEYEEGEFLGLVSGEFIDQQRFGVKISDELLIIMEDDDNFVDQMPEFEYSKRYNKYFLQRDE